MNEIITKTKYNSKAHKKLYYFTLFRKSSSFYFIMLICIALAAMVIYNTATAKDTTMNVLSYCIVGFTLVLTPLLMIARINSSIKKDAEARGETVETIVINKEKISRKLDGIQPVVISWKQVEGVNERPEYFFFFLNGEQTLIVDKDTFTQGTTEDLIRIIEKYGPKNKKGKSVLKKLKVK